jgi:hypothetical protein
MLYREGYFSTFWEKITKEGVVNIMQSKLEKNEKNDNKTKNSKSANPITMETDPKMHKPVRGLPNK